MRDLVDATMAKGGALGLATGLEYVPASFASVDEVIALAKVTAPYGGSYVTHMKDEGPGLLDSVRDAIRIGREAGVPVLINHHKATGVISVGFAGGSFPGQTSAGLAFPERFRPGNVQADHERGVCRHQRVESGLLRDIGDAVELGDMSGRFETIR